MMIWCCVLLALAQPRLNYKREMEERGLAQIEVFLRSDRSREAEQYLQDFEKQLFPSAWLHYEVALQYNVQGRLEEALRHYDRALALEPLMLRALYDRAEIHLLQDQVVKAQQDLLLLVEADVEHWVVYFRLAEIYAEQNKVTLFEEMMLQAIRYGFSMSILLEAKSKWKSYALDPVIGVSLRRIIQLYGDERIWELLQQ